MQAHPDMWSAASIVMWLVSISDVLHGVLNVVALLVAITAGIASLIVNWKKIRNGLRRTKDGSSK